jgi:hypothetical protein
MRIQESDIMIQLDGVNEILAKINSEWRIRFSGRYGYSVLEKVAANSNLPYSDPIVAGTKKECYVYAAALLRGMWLARNEY